MPEALISKPDGRTTFNKDSTSNQAQPIAIARGLSRPLAAGGALRLRVDRLGTPAVAPKAIPDSESLERLRGVVEKLLHALAAHDDRDAFDANLRRAGELLEINIQKNLAGRDEAASCARKCPGLAPWQVQKIRRFIDENIQSRIGVTELAALAGLSRCYFSRVFSQSFKDSPVVFIMRSRVQRAQALMLRTEWPMAQIAGDCGFVDQAHLSHCFRRFVGETPSAWRRAQTSPSTAGGLVRPRGVDHVPTLQMRQPVE